MQNLIRFEPKTKLQLVTFKTITTLIYIVFPPCWALAFFGNNIYEKLFKNKVTSVFNRYILPPAFVVGVFFYVFSKNDIYPFGNKTIAWCDMTQQGVPYWMNFKNVLEGEEGLFLNMGNASGLNGWSLLRGYFIYPLNYLALFFDHASMMEAATVLSVLKLALCSVTAMIFFKIACKKLNPSISVALSLMYSFCAFGLMYYQIINWPDMMYILPLYFSGVYLLINKGKIAMYSISLAFVMNNFSFGFMTVLATILFFGYYAVCNKKNDNSPEATKKVLTHFVFGSVVAAMLSAHSWLPFFSSYGSSARSVDLKESLASEPFFTSKNTIYPVLMSTAFIFVAVFSFKRYAKNAMEKAMMFLFGIMLIAVVLEPINTMWHGGSYMSFPGRYLYITTFLGLAMGGALLSRAKTADSELEADVPTKKGSRLSTYGLNICSFFLLAFIARYVIKAVLSFLEYNAEEIDNYATTLWGNSDSYKHTLVIFICFLFLYCLCYTFYRWKLINKRVLALSLVAVLTFEAYCAINIYVVPPTSKVNTESFHQYADLADRIDDDGFYRVKNNSFLKATYNISEANFPGAIGYNSTGHYSSLANETYLYFAKALGYSSMWMKIESFGGTKFSDALMSTKYSISLAKSSSNAIYKNEKYQITENEYFLPLGIFTTKANLNVNLKNITRYGYQEFIFDSLTGDKYDLFEVQTPVSSNCTYTENTKRNKGKYYINPTNKETAALNYTIKIDGTKTVYFDCFDEYSNELSEKIYNSFSITVNGKKVKSKYPVSTGNGILNLGTFTDSTVTISLGVLKKVECRSFAVFTMDDDLLDKVLPTISCANLNVDGNDITGNYKAKENGFLVVSVADIGGYKCYVNGEKVNISRAYGGLIKIPVKKGDNSISLTYTPPLVYPAIFIVILGIAISVAVLVYMRKKKYATTYEILESKLGKKHTEAFAKIAKLGTLLAFIAVIFAIYVYPMLIKLQTYLELGK